jgi:hypothetical protein
VIEPRVVEGCIGVADGDGKLPSLADTIAAVRRELSLAQVAGQGQAIQFRTGPVELEFEVAVTRTGGGQAGVLLWVLTLGGKGELAYASTQRIKITLQPVIPETGEDAQVADARRGENRPGPLRSQPSRCLGQADVGASVEAAWVLTGTGSASCMRQGPLRQAPARLPLGDRLVLTGAA